jgi:hypothetical protein
MRAIFHTYHMPRLYNDSVISEQFLKSKRLYAASALHALQNLNILNTPSLSLIQALISAVSLKVNFFKSVFSTCSFLIDILNAISRQHEPSLGVELLRRSADRFFELP